MRYFRKRLVYNQQRGNKPTCEGWYGDGTDALEHSHESVGGGYFFRPVLVGQ